VATHSGRRVSLIEVIFIGAVAGAISCQGAGGPSRAAQQRTSPSALTTAKTAAAEQTRTAAWASRAALYRRLSDANRQAIAALAAVPGRTAVATLEAKRQAAADLADRLAARAQKAAELHARNAADIAAQTAAGPGVVQ
jgi:hypothetical protein